ncbi:MAG TPA: sigma-70 family RNA polymerase sigma factor [Mycobacteriales bacterium]|nr:sigma-70 family RNA polymerase sigma factor [Mycobacteriales bacterium]
MEISTDATLIDAAIGGDERAFAALVQRHTPKIYRVALHLLGSRSDAEDCVQECWLTVWRQLHRYRGDAAVGTWLYRIAANTALMQIRRRRPTVALDELGDIGEIADRSAHADPDRSMTGIMVRQALQRLSDEHRAVLVLREFAGLSYDELGATLGLSVPAARSRLHRARLALTDVLQERQ